MSSGVGRGRGWLNLSTQSVPKAPGIEESPCTPTVKNNENIYSDDSCDFSDLVNTIKQLSLNDDGIKFNQKIKYIIEIWNANCQDGTEVDNSFDAIMNACLADADFATKFVLLITSRTFLTQEIHEKNIRLMFIRRLQDNYEDRRQMQLNNPVAFRNSVQMMGDFFYKARLPTGQNFSFMAMPVFLYLETLLKSSHVEDFKLFTMQFYLNGTLLKEAWPEKMAELVIEIRQILCCEAQLSKECKLWLLLALEVSNNRFSLLPTDTNNFYQDQLGDESMAYFQVVFGTHGILTVQTTQDNKTLDCYQSNVNVLQVSTSEPNNDSQNSVPDIASLSMQNNLSHNSNAGGKDNHTNKGGKTGRPILGAGARLNKTRNHDVSSNDNWHRGRAQSEEANWGKNQNQVDADQTGVANWYKNKPQADSNADNNWRDRDNRKSSQKSIGNGDKEKRKPAPKSTSKGWEHDDRFDTDYS